MKNTRNMARLLSFLMILAVLLTSGIVLGIQVSAEETTTESTESTETTEREWIPADEYESQVGDYAYSFAVLGDTQVLNLAQVNGKSNAYSELYDWIIRNAEAKKIKRVIGLGDITDATLIAEYDNAKAEFAKLEAAGIPYSFIRGNHDAVTDAQVEQYTTARKDANGQKFTPEQGIKFQDAFAWEDYGHLVDGSFSNDMINTYQKFEVGAVKYLILNIDYGPSNEVIAWMNEVISSNPDYSVIVATHIYLDREAGFSGTAGYDGNNNAETLWLNCLRRHENVVLVLSGHYDEDIVIREDLGIYKNKVTSFLIDPQGVDKAELNAGEDGAGIVAMFYFSEDGKMLDVEYYSTVRNAYHKASNQYYDMKIVLDEDEKQKTTYVSTASELLAAMQAGGDVTLLNDIEFSPSATASRVAMMNPIAPLTLRSGVGGPYTISFSDESIAAGFASRMFLTNGNAQPITLLDVIFDGNGIATTMDLWKFNNSAEATPSILNLGSPDEPGLIPEFRNCTGNQGIIYVGNYNVVNVYGAKFYNNTATTAGSDAMYIYKGALNVHGTLYTEADSIYNRNSTITLAEGAQVMAGITDSVSLTSVMAGASVDWAFFAANSNTVTNNGATFGVALLNDITLDGTETITIANAKSFDGMGHTIKRSENAGATISMFTLATSAEITLTNITLDGNGIVDADGNSKSSYGGAFYTVNKSTLVLGDGATIQGFSADHGAAIYGGATIILLDGSKITDNTANSNGPAIRTGGYVWMLGGEISNNVGANKYNGNWGAAISLDSGRFYMYGGTITGNQNSMTSVSAGKNSFGGAIGLTGYAACYIEGGTITGNKTYNASLYPTTAAIFVGSSNSTLRIGENVITDDLPAIVEEVLAARETAPSIQIHSNLSSETTNQFSYVGRNIGFLEGVNNIDTNFSIGTLPEGSRVDYVESTVTVDDVTTTYYGVLADALATISAGGTINITKAYYSVPVTLPAVEFTVNGGGNTLYCMASDVPMFTLAEGANVTLTNVTLDGNGTLVNSDAGATLTLGDGVVIYGDFILPGVAKVGTAAEFIAAIGNSGIHTIELTGNIYLGEAYSTDGAWTPTTTTIDRNLVITSATSKNGDIYTIYRGIPFASGESVTVSETAPMFTITAGANAAVVIKNVILDGQKAVTVDDVVTGIVDKTGSESKGGACFYMTKGQLVIENGAVIQNFAANMGAAVYASSQNSHLIMNGGIIQNNDGFFATAGNYAGSVIYVRYAEFVMTGGTIRNNTSAYGAGAIYIGGDNNQGHFWMYGGEIYGNTGVTKGAAITLRSGNFYMYGGTIENNTANNGRGQAVYTTSSGSYYSYIVLKGGTINLSNAKETAIALASATCHLYIGETDTFFNGKEASACTPAAREITEELIGTWTPEPLILVNESGETLYFSGATVANAHLVEDLASGSRVTFGDNSSLGYFLTLAENFVPNAATLGAIRLAGADAAYKATVSGATLAWGDEAYQLYQSAALAEDISFRIIFARRDADKNVLADVEVEQLVGETVKSPDWTTDTYSGAPCIVVSLAPKMAMDTIIVKKGGESVKAEGYTFASYLEDMKKNEAYSADAKLMALVDATLNYCAAAQTYFGYNNAVLANANVTTKVDLVPEVSMTLDDPNKVFHSAQVDVASTVSVAIIVNSNGIPTVKLGNTPYTLASENLVDVGGGYTAIVIPDLAASMLMQSITVELDGATLVYGVPAYAYNMQNKLEGSTETEHVNLSALVKALYAYAYAADDYAK